MTPFAESFWHWPMDRKTRARIGELLSGAQFFDCSALEPIRDVRSQMSDSQWVMDEFLSCELPADKTWIQIDSSTAVLLSETGKTNPDEIRFDCIVVLSFDSGTKTMFGLEILNNKTYRLPDHKDADSDVELQKIATRLIRSVWFSIEAMQTPGGLCHRINHNPSRQQIRSARRSQAPCHKWVEVKLGRDRQSSVSLGGVSSGRAVAWHYRRGHRVNHPNPNYPKWRKGCWAGSPEAGIRTHSYTVEVPG